jgi:YbbR domain-containing protein
MPLAGTIAHEFRHHWQKWKGIKFDSAGWANQKGKSYTEAIVEYFLGSVTEMDALLFELKYAHCDESEWRLEQCRITVKEIKSARIPVVIDELVTISKPVELQTTYVNKEYEVGDVTIVPAVVDVIGAKVLVDKVSYVQVKLSEEQLTEEAVTLQLSTEAVDNEGNTVQAVRLSSAYAEVTASLYATKDVRLQVPVEGVLAEHIELISQRIPQLITIKGPGEILQNIQEIIASPIQIESLTEDATLPIIPILPEGIEVAEESVNLTAVFKLSVVTEVSFDYAPEGIWIYNIPEGYSVDVLTDKVTVTARGDEAIINVLKSTDLQPAINASSLTVGETEVQGSTRYAQQLVSVNISPIAIKVRVTVVHVDEGNNE